MPYPSSPRKTHHVLPARHIPRRTLHIAFECEQEVRQRSRCCPIKMKMMFHQYSHYLLQQTRTPKTIYEIQHISISTVNISLSKHGDKHIHSN
eukprot:m.43518 g.43518  ORF g.43518 m.43518 type:complete len:93 (-) comp10558_c0_seq15:154-432(-)